MTKRIFFILGVFAGFLFAEVVRRKRMERLLTLEKKEAADEAFYADLNRRWKAELAAMPFEKRMDYELFEASLKSHNYNPDWDEEDDDEETD